MLDHRSANRKLSRNGLLGIVAGMGEAWRILSSTVSLNG
jgi:hypothetical protein